MTYMFITHDLSVVRHISDHIMVMYLGKCVEYAPTKEFFKNPMHPYSQALLRSIPEPTLEGIGKKIEILTGEVKSPVNPAPGCRFKPRCKYASELCTGDLELTECHKSLGGLYVGWEHRRRKNEESYEYSFN